MTIKLTHPSSDQVIEVTPEAADKYHANGWVLVDPKDGTTDTEAAGVEAAGVDAKEDPFGLDGLTVAELRTFAEDNLVDLAGARTKAEIRAAIDAAAHS